MKWTLIKAIMTQILAFLRFLRVDASIHKVLKCNCTAEHKWIQSASRGLTKQNTLKQLSGGDHIYPGFTALAEGYSYIILYL
jgi:hypothetical protein